MTKPPRENFLDTEGNDEVVPQWPSENGAESNVTNEEEANPTEAVELDIADPHFMANAHEIYADLRTKGPVSRVRFAGVGAEEERRGLGPGGEGSSGSNRKGDCYE